MPPSHDHRRPTRAYGPVRVPGLRWLRTGSATGSGVWLALLLAVVLAGRVAPVMFRTGNVAAGVLSGGAGLIVLGGYGLAVASRRRVPLVGDAQLRWRRVEQVVEELRELIRRRLPNARVVLRDVEHSRWEIALLFRDRAEVLKAYAEAKQARWGFDPADPQRVALEASRVTLYDRAAALDQQIEQRIGSLDRLVLALRSVNDGISRSDRRRRGRRARLAGEHADAALAATARWGDAVDPGAGVAEGADAYARAYRELSDPTSREAGWRA